MAEDVAKKTRQKEAELDRTLQGSLAENAVTLKERSQRADIAQAKARTAVVSQLKGPSSAEFRNVAAYPAVAFNKIYVKSVEGPPTIDVVCGEVNAKNSYGLCRVQPFLLDQSR